MAKCKSCDKTFDSQDGGAGCEHCGAVFCPTCEDMAGVDSCPYCPTTDRMPQILERVFTGNTWQEYLQGLQDEVDHVERMLARPAGVLREAEEVALRRFHAGRDSDKTKTATEDRDEPMTAPESQVRIVTSEVTCLEVKSTIASLLREYAGGFGITTVSVRRHPTTIELWGLWPVNSNSGTRASIKMSLAGMMDGVAFTYRRQRQVAADKAELLVCASCGSGNMTMNPDAYTCSACGFVGPWNN